MIENHAADKWRVLYEYAKAHVAELEASLDAMTARAAINGKDGLRYREALEEVKAFVCGEAVSKWDTDPQTTNSRIRIANTCDVALLNLPKG